MHLQSLQWIYDLHASGSIGGWELWQALKGLFNLPGNIVIELLGSYTVIAQTLGIAASEQTGYASLNGLIAKIISCAAWLFVFIQVVNIGTKPKRRQAYLDEDSKTQPLLLPRPKDYPVLKHPY